MTTKLVISIVQSNDADHLLSALRQEGFSSTRVSTTGGFLRQGNATILVGTEEGSVSRVLEVIQRNCHTYTRTVTPFSPGVEPGEPYLAESMEPMEVQVGGAVIFILTVERVLRY